MTLSRSGQPADVSLLADDVETDLRGSVRKAIERHAPAEAVNGLYDGSDTVTAPLWSAFGELGLPGLLVPESLGGAGASTREAAAVLEELGRAAAPSPFLTSSVVATTALVALRHDAAAVAGLGRRDRCPPGVPVDRPARPPGGRRTRRRAAPPRG